MILHVDLVRPSVDRHTLGLGDRKSCLPEVGRSIAVRRLLGSSLVAGSSMALAKDSGRRVVDTGVGSICLSLLGENGRRGVVFERWSLKF